MKMSLKLEDLIGKKKDIVQVLDLSKAKADNIEEFRRVMEKVPDFKIKPEKVKSDDIKIQDRPKRWGRQKKEGKYTFANPIPYEMRSLQLKDLCSVPIQWNMLTNLRPKSKLDEEYFSRLIELGKLELVTLQKEKKTKITDFLKKMKNRSGATETRFLSCVECGEDFCQKEVCCLFQYDDFRRKTLTDTSVKKGDKDGAKSNSRTSRIREKKRNTSNRSISKTRRLFSREESRNRDVSRRRTSRIRKGSINREDQLNDEVTDFRRTSKSASRAKKKSVNRKIAVNNEHAKLRGSSSITGQSESRNCSTTSKISKSSKVQRKCLQNLKKRRKKRVPELSKNLMEANRPGKEQKRLKEKKLGFQKTSQITKGR